MNHNDNNLKYDEAVVSFAAASLDLTEIDGAFGVINFAKSTMDGIKKFVDRFIAETPAANKYIEAYGKDEFGAYLAVDVGGYGDGFANGLAEAAHKFAEKARVYGQLDIVEGDDGWLHIEALER